MKVGNLVRKKNSWWTPAYRLRKGIVIKKCPSPNECIWVRFFASGSLECHHRNMLEVISESR